MAFDDELAGRVRTLLTDRAGVEEKRMFSGLAFLVDGKMCINVVRDGLMCRVGPEQNDAALENGFASPIRMKGKDLTGYVLVDPEGLRSHRELRRWVDLCLDYNSVAKAAPKKRYPKKP